MHVDTEAGWRSWRAASGCRNVILLTGWWVHSYGSSAVNDLYGCATLRELGPGRNAGRHMQNGAFVVWLKWRVNDDAFQFGKKTKLWDSVNVWSVGEPSGDDTSSHCYLLTYRSERDGWKCSGSSSFSLKYNRRQRHTAGTPANQLWAGRRSSGAPVLLQVITRWVTAGMFCTDPVSVCTIDTEQIKVRFLFCLQQFIWFQSCDCKLTVWC